MNVDPLTFNLDTEKVPEQMIPQQPVVQTMMPFLAVLLLIIAGVLGVFTWAMALVADVSSLIIPSTLPEGISVEQVEMVIQVCGIIGLAASIFAILSGLIALKRRFWWISFFGGVIGLCIIGPMFISSLLCLIGIILLVVSKKEFS